MRQFLLSPHWGNSVGGTERERRGDFDRSPVTYAPLKLVRVRPSLVRMARSKDSHRKRIRFTNVVARSGTPHAHTLWVSPEKDSELKQALKANRVMTIVQTAGGGKADYGTIGFDRTHAQGAQILIFEKSLRIFEDAKIIGIDFDLVEQPTKVMGSVAAINTRVLQRESRPKESRGAKKPSVHRKPPEKREAKNTPEIVDSGFIREVRAALGELEAGKSMAARRRLQRAAKLKL